MSSERAQALREAAEIARRIGKEQRSGFGHKDEELICDMLRKLAFKIAAEIEDAAKK